MSVKISTQNSKLGVIPSVNITPIVTCRPNCPCAKDCYAMKGRFRFASVKDSMTTNYETYIHSPEIYFKEIKSFIDDGIRVYSYFRWHAAGDIVDKPYLEGMVKLARELHNTSFLAFTKKHELINRYIGEGGVIPDNLHIVFSAWGNELVPFNPYGFPVAYVRFSDDAKNSSIPQEAIECSGDCTTCLQCWRINHGESVVFNKH